MGRVYVWKCKECGEIFQMPPSSHGHIIGPYKECKGKLVRVRDKNETC